MQYYQPLLLTPGPTPVPEQTLRKLLVKHLKVYSQYLVAKTKYLFLHLVALAY